MFRRSLLAVAFALAAAPAFATTYTLDPNHTQVQFVWNHFGFTNLTAQFGKIEGSVDFDAADPTKSSVTATISMDSVNSNVKKLDGELVGADYFDAAKFPTATFKSTRVEKGATPDHLKVTGDLSVHGVTRPVTLDVAVVKVGDHPMRKAPAAGFSATTTIKRSDFGITKYVPMVGDDVKINIVTEAIEAKAFAAGPKPQAK
ncbi:MAG TPA: YceI family protein [Rhodanobacteraceae bacterium]|jgi:polyisoprenoid-binding protein YceI|nr:YceI family protein [Rhodanobacteraceae bacterium]